jgi:quercetin dioxygenase-like cupin family protein
MTSRSRSDLLRRYVPCLLVVPLILGAAWAGEGMPTPILADTRHWASPPAIPGLRAAWLVGSENAAGAYIVRVRLAEGARVPPHRHPDERVTTVLAGTLHVGFGEAFDAVRAVAVPAGAVYVAPAGVPHFVWARDGEVLYQESGYGPTGTAMAMPHDR